MRFIFDEEVAGFVNGRLRWLTVEFDTLNKLVNDPTKDPERVRNAERSRDVFEQIKKELQDLEGRFAKYLQLHH